MLLYLFLNLFLLLQRLFHLLEAARYIEFKYFLFRLSIATLLLLLALLFGAPFSRLSSSVILLVSLQGTKHLYLHGVEFFSFGLDHDCLLVSLNISHRHLVYCGVASNGGVDTDLWQFGALV